MLCDHIATLAKRQSIDNKIFFITTLKIYIKIQKDTKILFPTTMHN